MDIKRLHDYLLNKNILVDQEDLEKIAAVSFYWNILKRKTDNKAYTFDNGKTVYLSRVIMNPVDGMVVDHINGNGLDNRKINLRICTQAQNTRNRTVSAGRKYKGITQRTNKSYRVRITVDGRCINVGDYLTEEKAIVAYNKAAIKYHGEYAKLIVLEN